MKFPPPPKNNSKSTLFSSRLSACPTQCLKSQVGTLQCSKQHKSQGVSFAQKRLAIQTCTRMSNRRGCCVWYIFVQALFRPFIPPFPSDILIVSIAYLSHYNCMSCLLRRDASVLFEHAQRITCRTAAATVET